VSMAALIRDAVGAILRGESRDARWVRAWTVVGKHASAERNLAVEHDRYLAEDYAG
nr:CopG family transcriptional regulator [Actinomycetota bacterium]